MQYLNSYAFMGFFSISYLLVVRASTSIFLHSIRDFDTI
nr:MAG TPA: hypothetical protein [Caudoviricetes sp.]